MTPNPNILAQQIDRLLLKAEDKKRLLEELKQLDAGRMEFLTDLIRQHDDEALKILNEKAAEQKIAKDHVNEARPDSQTSAAKEEVLNMMDQLELLFQNPEALAQFLVASDDVFLMELEELFLKGLEKNPTAHEEFKIFFSEIRLQKTAIANSLKKEDRENLVRKIASDEEEIRQLDELIANAENVLNSQKTNV
jgi:hypothetical protein